MLLDRLGGAIFFSHQRSGDVAQKGPPLWQRFYRHPLDLAAVPPSGELAKNKGGNNGKATEHYNNQRLGALSLSGSRGFSPKTSLFALLSGGATIAGSPVFHSGQLATRRAVFSTSFQYSAPVLTCNSRGFDITAMLILFERID